MSIRNLNTHNWRIESGYFQKKRSQKFVNFHFSYTYYSDKGLLLITVIYVGWYQQHLRVPQLLREIYCYMATNGTAVTDFYGLSHIVCVI